jgi:enoyl-CoA hydratase
VADLGTLQRITGIVGKGVAREMAFTGEPIDAQRALHCGLVNSVRDYTSWQMKFPLGPDH